MKRRTGIVHVRLFKPHTLLFPRRCEPFLLFLVLSVGQAAYSAPGSQQQSSVPPESTFFSTAAEETYSTYQLAGDGDLWPSCWAEDDKLYTANGDGTAFHSATARYDTAVSAISGMPPALTGVTLATNVGTNWSGPHYNRKPTGMLCVNGAIYLAFQNLTIATFDDVPAASIAKSIDGGVTWTWDARAPMFGTPGNQSDSAAYKFTTIFFLDYGKNSANAIDGYVYAYGLDNNWRFQQALYLARVPKSSIQNRAAWEFFAGNSAKDQPTWSHEISRKIPVLADTRLLYPVTFGNGCPSAQPVIGQGGVVFDAPLKRYIFASWSCATQEFYEAPNPWGPWRHFLSTDFGPLRQNTNYGQYGTSIPSKFISADGKTLYLQSNVWVHSYKFALRKLFLEPYSPASPTNGLSDANLALALGARAISKSTHFGSLCALDCSNVLTGDGSHSEDDFDQESKTVDWWGYIWPQPYNINRVVYETGNVVPEGGWYAGGLKVQVRQNFNWIDVAGASIEYPFNKSVRSHSVYTFSFCDTWGDGVRIIGRPGGALHFTSISRLWVFYGSEGKVAKTLETQVSSAR